MTNYYENNPDKIKDGKLVESVSELPNDVLIYYFSHAVSKIAAWFSIIYVISVFFR